MLFIGFWVVGAVGKYRRADVWTSGEVDEKGKPKKGKPNREGQKSNEMAANVSETQVCRTSRVRR